MKIIKNMGLLLRLLAVLAFSTTVLAAAHALTFIWLTFFVYQDNIRGYVPAGFTGMILLGLATLLLLFRLTALARRRHSNAVPYVAVGCLSAPAAIISFSIFSGLLLPFLGKYSWQKDVAISAVGGAAFTVIAIVIYGKLLSKKADNKGVQAIGDKSPQPDP